MMDAPIRQAGAPSSLVYPKRVSRVGVIW